MFLRFIRLFFNCVMSQLGIFAIITGIPWMRMRRDMKRLAERARSLGFRDNRFDTTTWTEAKLKGNYNGIPTELRTRKGLYLGLIVPVNVRQLRLQHSMDLRSLGAAFGVSLPGGDPFGKPFTTGHKEFDNAFPIRRADPEAADRISKARDLHEAAARFAKRYFWAITDWSISIRSAEPRFDLHLNYGRYFPRISPEQLESLLKDATELAWLLVAAMTTEKDKLQESLGRKFLTEVKSGRLESVRSLLDKGFDVNYQDDRYTTALHAACRVQQTAVAQFLIERGADVHAVDLANETPLHSAMMPHSPKELVALLLRSKPDIDLQNVQGETPLMLAVKWGLGDIVDLLLDAGANVAVIDYEGNTALDRAEKEPQIRARLTTVDRPGVSHDLNS